MFQVAKARKQDRDAIAQMTELLFPDSRAKVLPDDRFLVAKKDGVAVGFCHYRFREESCFIAGLGVLPQYRNHGVGSQLMAEALYHADKSGVQRTYLKVRALNHAAKLYTQFGFFEKKSGDTLTLVRKRPS